MALLKIKQIESLESELASKSDSGHVHAASDITSGAFATARIPNLAASKITSGTLGTARIPTLAQSKITGLVANVDDFETRIDALENAGGGAAVELFFSMVRRPAKSRRSNTTPAEIN